MVDEHRLQRCHRSTRMIGSLPARGTTTTSVARGTAGCAWRSIGPAGAKPSARARMRLLDHSSRSWATRSREQWTPYGEAPLQTCTARLFPRLRHRRQKGPRPVIDQHRGHSRQGLIGTHALSLARCDHTPQVIARHVTASQRRHDPVKRSRPCFSHAAIAMHDTDYFTAYRTIRAKD